MHATLHREGCGDPAVSGAAHAASGPCLHCSWAEEVGQVSRMTLHVRAHRASRTCTPWKAACTRTCAGSVRRAQPQRRGRSGRDRCGMAACLCSTTAWPSPRLVSAWQPVLASTRGPALPTWLSMPAQTLACWLYGGRHACRLRSMTDRMTQLIMRVRMHAPTGAGCSKLICRGCASAACLTICMQLSVLVRVQRRRRARCRLPRRARCAAGPRSCRT